MSRPISDSALDALRTWASFGRELLASRSRGVPDWKPVYRLIDAARQKLACDAERLKFLLNESQKRLDPLDDPFNTDLGVHRWLEEDREEAYSDWLEWVVRQVGTPARIFGLFNLKTPPEVNESVPFEAKRECCIPHGHEDHEGRLDLVIRYGDKAIIVVEVKKGDADEADTDKHEGYNEWLDEQDYPKECKYPVLLAVSAENGAYKGFQFVPWGSLCLEMRRLAVELRREKRVTTGAMVLAFVAAVEQNLLGFSAKLVQAICGGKVVPFNTAVVDHLERFVNTPET